MTQRRSRQVPQIEDEPMRLQKFLAHAGVASRRASEELITAGRVQVNGKTVTELGTKVFPNRDAIRVDGSLLRSMEPKVYYLVNKPVGYVTTAKDPQGRPTVLDLVNVKERVYPVGRLDYDSEGLVLLTNDGDVAYAMTHPGHMVTKHYLVEVKGVPSARAIKSLTKGVWLSDGKTSPAQVKIVSTGSDRAVLQMTIHEGRNRQIRRMCQTVGHPVLRLKRFEMGPLDLEGLGLGEFRALRVAEVRQLQELARQAQQEKGKLSRPRRRRR